MLSVVPRSEWPSKACLGFRGFRLNTLCERGVNRSHCFVGRSNSPVGESLGQGRFKTWMTIPIAALLSCGINSSTLFTNAGGNEFVGLFREETEPTDVCPPLRERHFLILLLVVRHRRCSLTLAIGMADGEPLHSGLLFLIESMAYGRRSSGHNSVMVTRHSPHFLFYIPKGTAMLGG